MCHQHPPKTIAATLQDPEKTACFMIDHCRHGAGDCDHAPKTFLSTPEAVPAFVTVAVVVGATVVMAAAAAAAVVVMVVVRDSEISSPQHVSTL